MTLILFDSNFTTIALSGASSGASSVGNFNAEVDGGILGVSALGAISLVAVTQSISNTLTLGAIAGAASVGVISISTSRSSPLTGVAGLGSVASLAPKLDLGLRSLTSAAQSGNLIVSTAGLAMTGAIGTTIAGLLFTQTAQTMTGAVGSALIGLLSTQPGILLTTIGSNGQSGNIAGPLLFEVPLGVMANSGSGQLLINADQSIVLIGTAAKADSGAFVISSSAVVTLSGVRANLTTANAAMPAALSVSVAGVIAGGSVGQFGFGLSTGITGIGTGSSQPQPTGPMSGSTTLNGASGDADSGDLSTDKPLLIGISAHGEAGLIRFVSQFRKKPGGRGATRSGKSPVSKQRLPARDTETTEQKMLRWKALTDALNNTPEEVTAVVVESLPREPVNRWAAQIEAEDMALLGL